MPDDVAEEKVKALLALGATVERVRPASIVDKKQYVVSTYQNALLSQFLKRSFQNLARRYAVEFGRGDVVDTASDPLGNNQAPIKKTPSVVVVTTASHQDADSPSDDDYITKPRGFFADQFEVISFIQEACVC